MLTLRCAQKLLPCVVTLLACGPSSDAHAALSLAAEPSVTSASAAEEPSDAAALRERHQGVLDQLSSTLRELYVDLAVAEQMAGDLEEHTRRGVYDALAEDEVFAQAVTADLQASSHDLHVALNVAPPATEAPAPRRPDASFGFGKSERLAGNVAVLPIFGFVALDSEPAQQAVTAALSAVADAAALIIDLRENNGGRAPTMAHVMSYFFEGPALLLARVERRYDGASYELWTQEEVPGARFGASKPMYLLTSSRTFSGGEALAYELQLRSRALVVGETTRGGDSLVERRELTAGFVLTLSTALGISPLTGRSRQGGVVPDVAVPAAQALDEAYRRALDALATSGGSGS